MAALLVPDYTVESGGCHRHAHDWPEFEKLLDEKRPRYYLTQVTAPTLRNDMYGVFLAKSWARAPWPSARM
jgi:anaerobic magnesium-protoporphyrin IX monomethyl ester cyclase